MIQRIQSLYLLLAALALAAFALIGVPHPARLGAYPWLAYALVGLAGLGVLLSSGAIFAYKDRAKQRQLVGLGQWLVLLLAAVLAVTFVLVPALQATLSVPVSLIGYLMVVIAYVFIRLAHRAIGKDIALVRSMDRLR